MNTFRRLQQLLGKSSDIRPSLEYCSHIRGAATPTTLSILDAVQRRAIRLIGDPALICHLQPLSQRRAVGDLSLFYRYLNGYCSSELTSIISPLVKLDAPAELLLLTPGWSFFIHQELDDTTAPLSTGCLGPGMDCLVMYLLSLRVFGLFKPRVNKLSLTQPSLSSRSTLVFRPCLRGLLSYKKMDAKPYCG
nr:unnamed protein product [Callosobruchus chinensis]